MLETFGFFKYVWKRMKRVVILGGSNLGDREANLEKAEALIAQEVGEIFRKSSLYETEPWGMKDQPAFLNYVIIVQSELLPDVILQKLLSIEEQLGRKRTEKWAPRLIDLDILFYDDIIFQSDHLMIPHPFIQERRFTLLPLCELMPEFVHPQSGLTIGQLLDQCQDDSKVYLFTSQK